jgi:hypothetical protein
MILDAPHVPAGAVERQRQSANWHRFAGARSPAHALIRSSQ